VVDAGISASDEDWRFSGSVVATGVTVDEGVREAEWPGGTKVGGESNEVAAPCFVVIVTLQI
jgi:hypothetical protein